MSSLHLDTVKKQNIRYIWVMHPNCKPTRRYQRKTNRRAHQWWNHVRGAMLFGVPLKPPTFKHQMWNTHATRATWKHTCTSSRAARLTCVPKFLVSVNGEYHQQVSQNIHHYSEYEETPESSGDPGRPVKRLLARVQCRIVQWTPIHKHCISSWNFSQLTR